MSSADISGNFVLWKRPVPITVVMGNMPYDGMNFRPDLESIGVSSIKMSPQITESELANLVRRHGRNSGEIVLG